MKNKLSIPYLILIINVLFLGCGPEKKENKNKLGSSALSLHVGDEKYFMIDTKESVVAWKGFSLNGLNKHNGYVYISKGELKIENGELRGGIVEIDMNTIEDKDHEHDNKLVNHLKSPDFFEIGKFPFSSIEITKVTSINDVDKEITGNLTIKGITHPVTFQIKMEVMDGIVKASGKLIINRTKWYIHYKSGDLNDLLANNTISESIEFEIKIVAKK
jgi:polyisoprenoid-binding protein YceI